MPAQNFDCFLIERAYNKIDIDDACNYKLWKHESEIDLSKFTQDAKCQAVDYTCIVSYIYFRIDKFVTYFKGNS